VLTNFDQGIAFYEQIKKDGQDRYDFSQPEVDLFNTAKYLMRRLCSRSCPVSRSSNKHQSFNPRLSAGDLSDRLSFDVQGNNYQMNLGALQTAPPTPPAFDR
jgi:hypothetical protein